VYSITAENANGIVLEPQPGTPLTVALVAPNAEAAAVVYRLDGTTWTAMTTVVGGCSDVFETVSTRAGDFALMVKAVSTLPGNAGSAPVALIVIVLALVVVLTSGALFVLRRSNR
jgi:hypothetical protein